MKKYHIEFNKPELDESEIDSMRDFDGLMERHQDYVKRRDYRRTVIVTITLLSLPVLVTASYFDLGERVLDLFRSKDELKQEQPAREVTQPFEEVIPSIQEEAMPEPVEIEAGETAPELIQDQNYNTLDKELYIKARPSVGVTELYDFFKTSIRYPQKALEDSITGTVNVSFVIEENGLINHIRIRNGISPEIDQEALRLARSMPPWKPATLNGKPVRSKVSIPIKFEIQSQE